MANNLDMSLIQLNKTHSSYIKFNWSLQLVVCLCPLTTLLINVNCIKKLIDHSKDIFWHKMWKIDWHWQWKVLVFWNQCCQWTNQYFRSVHLVYASFQLDLNGKLVCTFVPVVAQRSNILFLSVVKSWNKALCEKGPEWISPGRLPIFPS